MYLWQAGRLGDGELQCDRAVAVVRTTLASDCEVPRLHDLVAVERKATR